MVSLYNPHILKTLSLDILGQGLNFEESVNKLTLVDKVTCKSFDYYHASKSFNVYN